MKKYVLHITIIKIQREKFVQYVINSNSLIQLCAKTHTFDFFPFRLLGGSLVSRSVSFQNKKSL